MAERPEGYGFTKEVQDQISSKYDESKEQEACEWIMHYVKDADLEGINGMQSFHEKLKDGVILCKLINAIAPGSVKKINKMNTAFQQMENILNFINACAAYGCRKDDLFQTVALFEGTNMAEVQMGLAALGRKCTANGLKGIGPKESKANKREFSEEQLRAGEGVVGLQAGYNKGASQAGQNFGKTRSITSDH